MTGNPLVRCTWDGDVARITLARPPLNLLTIATMETLNAALAEVARHPTVKVLVSMQVGHVLEAMPSEHARPMYLDRIACDFPELKMIGAHTGWPWVEELISVCYKWENVWLGVDA